MNFGFKVILVDQGPKGCIYTILVDGESRTEFEKFASNERINETEGFQRIMQQLENMMDRLGFQDHLFRHEGTASDSVAALSKQSKKIRLYCCRWSERTLILGCGEVKNVATVQEDPILDKFMKSMMYVDRRLVERIRDDSVRQDVNGQLSGDLYFPSED